MAELSCNNTSADLSPVGEQQDGKAPTSSLNLHGQAAQGGSLGPNSPGFKQDVYFASGRMQFSPSGVADIQKLSPQLKVSSDHKEEVHKHLGRILLVPVQDGKYKSPVITLNHNEIGSVYTVIEKHFRQEFLLGADKFWKIVRTDQNLETWRPRVHGVQLKALLNVRLPESEEEFQAVETALANLSYAIKPESNLDQLVTELRNHVGAVEVWWDNRNRRPDGSLKRPTPTPNLNPSLKRQNMGTPAASGGYLCPPNSVKSSQLTGPENMMNTTMYGNVKYSGYQGSGFVDLMNDPANAVRDISDENGYIGPHETHMVGAQGKRGLMLNQKAPITLSVGGVRYHTSVGTLLTIQGSYFWNLLHTSDPDSVLSKTPSGDYFIDRNGKLFGYVLDYLRAYACGDVWCPLPDEPSDLQALAKEAEYYQLPGLIERIQSSSVVPQPGTRALYDSLYLETGFNSIEGPSLKEMEQRKVVVMQQMNHILQQKQADGFFVESCKCGVNHRETQEGGMQHNLYYHILLKKVVLVLPRRMG